MKITLKLFFGVFFLLHHSVLFGKELCSIIPQHMTCEYVVNPQGLDVKFPRFGWGLAATNPNSYGQHQRAYRILVATNEGALKKEIGDMWDSGWVKSAETQNIEYLGKALQSDRTYYWKVLVKDEKDKTSNWSTTATWTTGILEENLWKAKWIGGTTVFDPTQKDCNLYDLWLRKGFILKFKPKQANLYVASIGFHEVYVNGQRVGDEVMAPVVTDHTKRARYVAYDIASFLRKGPNVIAIWLGASWSIFPGYHIEGLKPRTPLVAAQVDFYDRILKVMTPVKQSLFSDESWKIKDSPNKLLGIWDFGRMGGELWDDRKAEVDWNQVKYDDANWSNAKEYNLPLKISAQNVKGNKIYEEIKPIAIEEKPDGSYRVDMGVNFAGWTQIKVKGNEGDTVHLSYSEREKEEITFGLQSAIVIGKEGTSTFKNRFNYSSGRWITIKGLKYPPVLEDIKGWLIHSEYDNVGDFVCSDTLQNWIYDRVKWTFRNLSLGGFIVDCPQRERMGYGGDAHATSETGMFNFNLSAFYTKWMQDWRDVQGTEPMVGDMNDPKYARKEITSGRFLHNGVLPHTAPTYWGGGGPAWGGIVVTLPWTMYQQYGDKRVLEENYGLIKKWLSFLDSHVEGHLLTRFGGKWDFLGDWLWPNATAEGMNNDKEETLCLNNLYRVYNLRTAVKIANLLGDKDQSLYWEQQISRAITAINRRFYDEENKIYADGSMANLSTALLVGVVPSNQINAVTKNLEKEILVNRDGHIHAGITGGALLFKYLRESGRNDLIYQMTSKSTYPSWGYMKENGATTIWEMWEKDLPGHSLLHSSYLYPGSWYIYGVLGIKGNEIGFKSFIIEPPRKSETSINWAKGSYNSPAGLIESNWSREGDKFKISIAVPANTSCLLKLDPEDAKSVLELSEIITKVGEKNGKVIFSLAPGRYNF